MRNFLPQNPNPQLSKAVESLPILARKGIRLPTKNLAHLIKQCADTKSLKLGKWVHLHLKTTGLHRPATYLSNRLIEMYSKCGRIESALKVFDKMCVRNLYSWNNLLSGYVKKGMVKSAKMVFGRMTERDVVSWNTMVIGYAKGGMWGEAVRCYREFRGLGIGFNEFSFAGVVMVCVKSRDLRLSRQVHGQVLVTGFSGNVVVSSSVVDAYAKGGEMGDARRLFDEMSVRDVHCWTTMVSGYAKWGDMRLASELFEKMPEKNSVSWTAMIGGYARNSQGYKALELFTDMMRFCVRPDQFTFSSCLCACASIASLKHGKQIHAFILRMDFRPNTIVVSSLIDMYSKCGSLESGRLVFELMGYKQDVVLWNTMISALAQHGRGEEAIQVFNDMVRLGVKPVSVTLVVVLSACSHSGLVEEGLRLFECMTSDHGIVPNQEHYACLIDVLGRAGHFDKLIEQLRKMPFLPDEQILNALLGVCKLHGNIELGRRVAEHLIELDPESSAPYVLLSGIYAELGKWDLVQNVRQFMSKRQVKKEIATSWIEIENHVYAFTASDRSHPSNEVIYSALERLTGQIEEDNNVIAEV